MLLFTPTVCRTLKACFNTFTVDVTYNAQNKLILGCVVGVANSGAFNKKDVFFIS